MQNYVVQTGTLSITILAESAYEAALEAVRWWEDSDSPAATGAGHRANLDAVTEVRVSRSHRPCRLFPTFNLLARAHRESPAQAWRRVLREKVGQVN